MMMALSFVLLAVVLTLAGVHAQEQDPVPRCNSTIVKNIHNYWKTKGYPNYWFNEANVKWTVYKITDIPRYKTTKCLTYTPLGCDKLSINADGKITQISATQKDGMITIANDPSKHYLIIGTKNIQANYHCSDDGPTTGVPEAGITISPHATRADKTRAETVQKELGFDLVKSFNCIVTE